MRGPSHLYITSSYRILRKIIYTFSQLINFSLFQIDTLNKRSKAAENAFLLLYKQFLEIPGKKENIVFGNESRILSLTVVTLFIIFFCIF